VRSLVLSDAAGAFERAKRDDAKLGIEMLADLRARFRARRQESDQLYDSTTNTWKALPMPLRQNVKWCGVMIVPGRLNDRFR